MLLYEEAPLSNVEFPAAFVEYHPPLHGGSVKKDFCCQAQCVCFNSRVWRPFLMVTEYKKRKCTSWVAGVKKLQVI